MAIAIEYRAEPTPAAFHASEAFVRGIMGPIGAGKSVACCMDLFSLLLQQPVGRDNIRRSRWGVIRNTYPDLKATTIKTWQDWIPSQICPVTFGSPIVGRIRRKLPDRTKVDAEIMFIALDRADDVKKLKSLELTGGWINECSEVPKPIFDMLTGRVARYPPKHLGPLGRACVLLDTNAVDDDHWYYTLAEEEKPEGYAFFRQPPAIVEDAAGNYVFNEGQIPGIPAAENEHGQPLGRDYWLRLIPGKTHAWIRVYLQSKYGTVQEGKPVYPEYNEFVHVAKERLKPYEGLPLWLGWDFGLTPACVIAQLSPRGQLRILDEILGENMGIVTLARDVVKPYLANMYSGFSYKKTSVGDPAGNTAVETDESSCIRELGLLGLPTMSAPTNAFKPRREAVAGFLTKMVDGQPGLLLSPHCRRLKKGFGGGYKHRRMLIPGEEIYRDEPVKNIYSHPHDALQYIALQITREAKDDDADTTAAVVRPRSWKALY